MAATGRRDRPDGGSARELLDALRSAPLRQRVMRDPDSIAVVRSLQLSFEVIFEQPSQKAGEGLEPLAPGVSTESKTSSKTSPRRWRLDRPVADSSARQRFANPLPEPLRVGRRRSGEAVRIRGAAVNQAVGTPRPLRGPRVQRAGSFPRAKPPPVHAIRRNVVAMPMPPRRSVR